MFIVFYERKLKLRGMFFKRALRAFEIVHVFFVFIRLVFAYHCGIVVFILFPFLICFVLFLCSYRFEKCFSSRQQRGHGGGPDVRIPGAESWNRATSPAADSAPSPVKLYSQRPRSFKGNAAGRTVSTDSVTVRNILTRNFTVRAEKNDIIHRIFIQWENSRKVKWMVIQEGTS